MKIDWLIGIVTLLLQREKMTAPELAERFEVSKRTINRDIEDLCKAGLPIVTAQGANGGVSILDSYKIDKTLFTAAELRAIFAGLSSLDSVAQDRKYRAIVDKLSPHGAAAILENHIMIDLSAHYKDTLAPKIELLRACIEDSACVRFTYYNQSGERPVVLDPYLVVFQWGNWYVLGFAHAAMAFRLYKLNRILGAARTLECFEPREIPEQVRDFERCFPNRIQAVIRFDKSQKYRLIEEYGPDSFQETADGVLLFSLPFTNEDYLLTWVLGFGEHAELIEPRELRSKLAAELKNTWKRYGNDDI